LADPPAAAPPPQDPPAPRVLKVAPDDTQTQKPNTVTLQVPAPPAVSGNDPVAVLTTHLSQIAGGHPKHLLEEEAPYVLRVVFLALDETRTPPNPSLSWWTRTKAVLADIYRQNSGWAADLVAGGQVNLHWRFVDGGEPFGVRPPGSNQLGHFLTGLGHGLAAMSIDRDQLIALDMGHELVIGDENAVGAGMPFVGAFKTALSNMNRDVTGQVDLTRLDVDLAAPIQQYVRQVLTGGLMNQDVKDPGKSGFSVQDLRLTAMAWHAASLVSQYAFASVDQLNTWLTNNLGTHASDPESLAPAPANPAGPWLNDRDYKTNPGAANPPSSGQGP
jgi:hypothetical protein